MGVGNVWEQEKLEARKMPENAAESHTSGARFVGRRFVQDFMFVNCNYDNLSWQYLKVSNLDSKIVTAWFGVWIYVYTVREAESGIIRDVY